MNRMRHPGVALALVTALIGSPAVHGQSAYPSKTIRFVVPFAPGGGTDFLARLIAGKLTESMGQPVIVDNRPGGGGITGADIVAKSPPDGYTILLGSPGSLSINPNFTKTPYDPQRDFTPLSLATLSPFAVAAHSAVAANSVKELIALAKARPGTLNYGTAGNGSAGHFSGEYFRMLTGINIVHVPFKGSALSSAAVLGGEIQLTFENLPIVLPLARGGKMKILGVGSNARSPLAPDVPTIAETVAGYESVTAFGVLAPARLPPAIVHRLHSELVKALNEAKISDQLSARGMQTATNTPAEYAQFLRREFQRYGDIIKKTGITID
jgi:tripartite-type tricarboxylate transporter receptor subunit TctC